ncbi:MAG: cellulose biosynthesis cyclic di-GMP-binding regulatory protein BcsB, partial [bacterium]
EEYSMPLGRLTGSKEVSLLGVNPSARIYLPIPEDWDIRGGALEIRFSHSSTLLKESTMTVKVNDVPAGSVRLTQDNVDNAVWKVKVPTSALKSDLLAVTFLGYLRTTDDPCHDLQDAGTWVSIDPESTLRLTARSVPLQANLGLFPFPFYRARSLENPAVLVVLPDGAEVDDWASVLPLASYLGQVANWRDFSVYAIREQELTAELARAYDLIFAGRASQIRWLRGEANGLPLRLTPEGKFEDRTGNPIPEDHGVIMEVRSPFNAARGVLIVTGTTTEALHWAVQALLQPAFPSLARGNYAVIPRLPQGQVTMAGRDWNRLTIGDLGYGDQIFRGLGKQTSDVVFDLPPNQSVRSAQVTVDLSHSPFVTTDRSYFNVLLNDVPVKGVYLTSRNEKPTLLQVDLPAKQFHGGRNTVRFQFELRLADKENCADNAWEQAWGVVHQDTRLSIQFDRSLSSADLATFPSPFEEPTLLLLPSQAGPNELAGAFLLMTQLGREIGDKALGISVASAAKADRKDLEKNHVILLGRIGNDPIYQEVASRLPFAFTDQAKSLQGLPVSLQVLHGQPIGVLEVLPSPWNDTRTALAVTGSEDEGVGWAVIMLSDPVQQDQLAGNVAVIDSTGTLTTLDTRQSPPPRKGLLPGTRPTPEWASNFGLIILLLLVVPVGVILGRRLWSGQRPRH